MGDRVSWASSPDENPPGWDATVPPCLVKHAVLRCDWVVCLQPSMGTDWLLRVPQEYSLEGGCGQKGAEGDPQDGGPQPCPLAGIRNTRLSY